MLFRVRKPFVVQLHTVETVDQEGRQLKRQRVTEFPGGQEVSLNEKQARIHLHQLEPVDAEAKKFMDDIHEAKAAAARARAAATAAPVDPGVSAELAELRAQNKKQGEQMEAMQAQLAELLQKKK